jgi:hypothetical protein
MGSISPGVSVVWLTYFAALLVRIIKFYWIIYRDDIKAIKAGILFNPYGFWLGIHYSAFNKRLCINLFPMLTIWIAFEGGASPRKCR